MRDTTRDLALVSVLATLAAVLVAGCAGAPGGGGADGKVLLSATSLGGEGAELIRGGQRYPGTLEVGGSDLVGVVSGGVGYLYHPSQGDIRVDLASTRRALALALLEGEGAPAAPADASGWASVRVEDLAVGDSVMLGTRVKVTRTDADHVAVANYARRWAAVRAAPTGGGGTPPKAVFLLPTNSVAVAVPNLNWLNALRKYSTGTDYEKGDKSTLTIKAGTIETYGAIIRAASLWRVRDPWISAWPPPSLLSVYQSAPAEVRGALPPRIGEAFASDAELFAQLNAYDLAWAVFNVLRQLAGQFPNEAVDLVAQSTVSLAEGLALVWADVPDESGAIRVETLFRSLDDFGVSLAQAVAGLAMPPTEVAWTLLDVVRLVGWAYDMHGASTVDAQVFSAYDSVPLRPTGSGAAYGVNLLRNPGAEEGESSDQHPTSSGDPGLVAIPGWETRRGSKYGYVREYSVTGGTGRGSGAKYFAPDLYAYPAQYVDLSAFWADIAAGLVEYRLSAALGVHQDFGCIVKLFAGISPSTEIGGELYSRIGPGPGIETDMGTFNTGVRHAWVVIEANSGGVDDVSLVLSRKASTGAVPQPSE